MFVLVLMRIGPDNRVDRPQQGKTLSDNLLRLREVINALLIFRVSPTRLLEPDNAGVGLAAVHGRVVDRGTHGSGTTPSTSCGGSPTAGLASAGFAALKDVSRGVPDMHVGIGFVPIPARDVRFPPWSSKDQWEALCLWYNRPAWELVAIRKRGRGAA